MKRFTIIPAAGSGQRFGSVIPKQFVELNGKPVLMHTIEKFAFISEKIILVLPLSHIDFWKTLCNKFSFHVNHTIVEGGITRTDSVKNGLSEINESGVVAIHDAVRPLVSIALIKKLFAAAEEKGNAVPAISLKDSLRQTETENNFSVDRKNFKIIQTPQCFDVKKLKTAYANLSTAEFTDDASVYELTGEKIYLLEGESSNIKITESIDLLIASTILKSK